MSENNSLYLVDGSSLAFRSFFALITSGLRRGDGMATWAIIGFFNSLFELIEKRAPHSMAVSFDLSGPTFRHEEFKEYKAHRQEMPDDLKAQWPIIKEGVRQLGIPIYEVAGYEADDVIGTTARIAERKGMQVVILTGDQDAFQLLDDKVQVLMPTTKDGIVTFGRQEVFNKLGIWPEQVIDYKGLVGDSSDNIPGVRGIGPKTAVQLLSQYQTIEGIYEHLAEISSNSVRTKLETGKESAFASKNLATIRIDVPVTFDFDSCRLKLPEVQAVVDYFRSVEANAILKRLPRVLKAFNDGEAPYIDPVLLEPVGKPMRRSMSFKKETVRQEVIAGEQITVATKSSVAVVEQQQLQLSVNSAVASATITRSKINAPTVQIVQTAEQLEQLTAALAAQKIIAVSVLTDNHSSLEGQPVGYAVAYAEDAELSEALRPQIAAEPAALMVHTAYIPVGHKGGEQQLDANTVIAALKPILENPCIGKISYNAKPEMNALALSGVEYGPLVFDPLLASYVIDPDDNHKLKEQAQRIFGYSLPALTDLLGSGKKQQTWDLLPLLTASQYAADSARLSLLLSAFYLTHLDHDQLDLLFEEDFPLCAVLAKMEQNGVKIDIDYFQEFSKELSSELVRLESEIFQLAGHEFNINSPLQLQKVLFQELKLPTKGKTKSGYSTDASVLEALSEEHAIVRKILEYRHLAKLSSTYVESLPRQISNRDGRLHGEFNQAATATGRLSSTNPNLQNIPIRTAVGQRIRRGFVATDEQHLLLSADYSQIELRLLAHMSGDEKLIDAFRQDQDIHSRTAMDIFDLTQDQLTADHRRVGKTLNFALIYQQGAFATAQQLGVSTKQAQEFISKYFASYPKVRAFMTSIINEARANSYVQTLWGRRRYFKNLEDRNDNVRKADERAACNAPLQGSAADLIKRAMIRLDADLRHRNLNAKLILQVHDELVFDVPVSEIEETKKAIVAAMSLDQPLAVPLKVDIGAGPNWMDAK